MLPERKQRGKHDFQCGIQEETCLSVNFQCALHSVLGSDGPSGAGAGTAAGRRHLGILRAVLFFRSGTQLFVYNVKYLYSLVFF